MTDTSQHIAYHACAACIALLSAGCARTRSAPQAQAPPIQSTVIRDVRVFDGSSVLARATVLVRGGRIAEVGTDVAAPGGAEIIDGVGKTLLPGLIDAHAHVWNEGHLEQSAVFGATTVLDMGCSNPKRGAELRTRSGEAGSRLAELRFAGYAVTVPGGHCTEYGFPVPTLTEPSQAQAFVDARIAEGSDYIKIIYDDGRAYGLHFPTLSQASLAATVAAAHARGKLALVHIGTLQDARDAIEAGADGLAHLFVDRGPDPEFGSLLASHHAFAVPTLSVLRTVTGSSVGPVVAADPLLAAYLPADAVAQLQKSFPVSPERTSYPAAEETVRLLHAAKVPLLAGTDSPNPGTTHGASVHAELELLVKAGLSPIQALSAGTSAVAERFGLRDRGRIASGMRADLVLVQGDPTTDIRATKNIELVWKAGERLDRAAYASRLQQERAAAKVRVAASPLAGVGLIADFEDLGTRTLFGAGLVVSTDQLVGGKSTAELSAVAGGAAGSKGALLVSGEVQPGVPFAWAGVLFSPGERPLLPANLSSKKALSFSAQGDGQTYQVLLFSRSRGRAPARRTFMAGPDWREFTFRFSDFDGMDGSDMTGIAFVGGPTPGKLSFRLDDLRLQ